jgi:hypothetical protein
MAFRTAKYESLVVFRLAAVNIENIDATILINQILHNTHMALLLEVDGKRN